ncbi:hypothetical protein [Sulfuricurvum sp.]|uniref:hypothetical protein n=1 Tax=Sulfuricurvum sp. TaxID=2025608 RepID=UPI002608B97E|nr:hypothetical protein [Sulfuricurvum sp.]
MQIETLYGVVNQDRRIIGSSSGDAPATIPVDSDTVTYFFNKYLITDPSTRELVKAYVKIKLGEDFPEISVSLWDRMSGSAQAIQEEGELAQLQEFENVSRRWIKELLQDLNKQVQKEWTEARLRQEIEKFKTFSEQFGKAFNNIDEVIAYYTKLKTLEKQKALFPAKLAELQKIKTGAEANAQSPDFALKQNARGVFFKLAEESNVFAVNAMVISEYALEKEFAALQLQALDWVKKLDKEIDSNKGEIVQNLHTPDKKASPTMQEFEKSLLEPFKPPLELANEKTLEYKEPAFDELQKILSNNDLEGALRFVSEWVTLQDTLFKELGPLFNDKLNAVESSKPSVNTTPHIQWLKSENKKIQEDDIRMAQESLDLGWKNAKEKTVKAYDVLEAIAMYRYRSDKARLNEMINHVMTEMKRVSSTVYQQRNALGTFLQKLSGTYGKGYSTLHDFNPDNVTMHWKPDIENASIGANAYLKEHVYTAIGKINDEGVSLHSVEHIIASRKELIIAPSSTHDAIIASLSSLESALYSLEAVKSEWKNFPKLDDQTLALFNDLASKTETEAEQKAKLVTAYTIEESNGIRQLYGNVNGYRETIRKVDERMSNIDLSKIRSEATQYLTAVESELSNRQRDYEYLDKLQKQWREWYTQLLSQDILSMDAESGKMVLTAGMKRSKEGNYAIIFEPYSHYALEKELAKNEKLEKVKKDLVKLNVYQFIQGNMPNTKALLNNFFEGKAFKPAPEDNFLVNDTVVWKSTLEKCEKLIGEMDIKKEDSYLVKLKEIAPLLPFTVTFPPLLDDMKNSPETVYYAKYGKFNDTFTTYSFEDFPLGKKFIELRLRIQELMALKGKLIEQKRLEESVVESVMLREVKTLHAKVEVLAISETQEYIDTYKALNAEHKIYAATLEEAKTKGTPLPDQMLIANLLYKIQERLASHSDAVRSFSAINQQSLIQELYQRFAQEYSNKNLSSLMSLLSDEWMSSSDGTTLMDLEETLGNSFSIFNEVKCTIDSLYISPAGANKYRVNYTITIEGYNYENDIKHVEKSSVSEEVEFIDGKVKIVKTLNGKYWTTR